MDQNVKNKISTIESPNSEKKTVHTYIHITGALRTFGEFYSGNFFT